MGRRNTGTWIPANKAYQRYDRLGVGQTPTILISLTIFSFALTMVILSPANTVFVIALMVATLLVIYAPYAFFYLCISLIIVEAVVQQFIPAVSILDEIVVVGAVLSFSLSRIMQGKALRSLPGQWWFLGFLLCGVFSSLLRQVPIDTWATGAFLFAKPLILAFAALQLEWTQHRILGLIRFGKWIIFFLLVTGAASLALGEQWYRLWGITPIESGLGTASVSGLFPHPAAFSRLAVIALVAVVLYSHYIKRGGVVRRLSIVALSILTLASFRMKSIASAIAGLLLTVSRTKARGRMVVVLVALVIGAVVVQDVLVAAFADRLGLYLTTETARFMLLAGALSVAWNYVPFGAGFGRYGSATAASDYSPEYTMLGFNNRWGLGNANEGNFGGYLMDNQWPAILGESGWVGLLFFVIGTIKLLGSVRRFDSEDDDNSVRYIGAVAYGSLVVLLAESVASPAFTSGPGYIFFAVPTAIYVGALKRARPL